MSDTDKIEPAPATTSAPTRPTSVLTNPKDQAARPGFRSPANARTKAQKGGRKK